MHAYYHDRNARVTDPVRQLVDENTAYRRRLTVKEDHDLKRPLRAWKWKQMRVRAEEAKQETKWQIETVQRNQTAPSPPPPPPPPPPPLPPPTNDNTDAASAQDDGTPTQVGVCGQSPAGVEELVDVPELPDDAWRLLAGMLEASPPHTPTTTPPMPRIQ